MDPVTLIILMLALAIVLMVADLRVPSGGILSILGVGLLMTVVIVGFTVNRWLGVASLFGGVVTSPLLIVALRRSWRDTPSRRRALREAEMKLPTQPAVRVGSVGVTVVALDPAGQATFELEGGVRVTIDVHADAPPIPARQLVRVESLDHGRPVVAPTALPNVEVPSDI